MPYFHGQLLSVFQWAAKVYEAALDIPWVSVVCTGILCINTYIVAFFYLRRTTSTEQTQPLNRRQVGTATRSSGTITEQGYKCRQHNSNAPNKNSEDTPGCKAFSRVPSKTRNIGTSSSLSKKKEQLCYFRRTPFKVHDNADGKIRIAKFEGGRTRWVGVLPPSVTDKNQPPEVERSESFANKEDEETLDDITWGMDSPYNLSNPSDDDNGLTRTDNSLACSRPQGHHNVTLPTNSSSDVGLRCSASWEHVQKGRGHLGKTDYKLHSKQSSSPECAKHKHAKESQKHIEKEDVRLRNRKPEPIPSHPASSNRRNQQRLNLRQTNQTNGLKNELPIPANKSKRKKKKEVLSRPSSTIAVTPNPSDPSFLLKRDSWIWFSTEARPNAEDFTTRKMKFQSSDPRVAIIAEEIRRQELQNLHIEREAESLIDSQSILSCVLDSEEEPRSTGSPHFKLKRNDYIRHVEPKMGTTQNQSHGKNTQFNNLGKAATGGTKGLQNVPSVNMVTRHRQVDYKIEKAPSLITSRRRDRVESPPKLLNRTSATADSCSSADIKESSSDGSLMRQFQRNSRHPTYRHQRPTHWDCRGTPAQVVFSPTPSLVRYPDASDKVQNIEQQCSPSLASSQSRDIKHTSLDSSPGLEKDAKTQEKLVRQEVTHTVYNILFNPEKSATSLSGRSRDVDKPTTPDRRQLHLGSALNETASNSPTDHDSLSWRTGKGDDQGSYMDGVRGEGQELADDVVAKGNNPMFTGEELHHNSFLAESRVSRQTSSASFGGSSPSRRKINIYSKDYYLGKKASKLRACEKKSRTDFSFSKTNMMDLFMQDPKASNSRKATQPYTPTHSFINDYCKRKTDELFSKNNNKSPPFRSRDRLVRIVCNSQDTYSLSPENHTWIVDKKQYHQPVVEIQEQYVSRASKVDTREEGPPECFRQMDRAVRSKINSFNKTYHGRLWRRNQRSLRSLGHQTGGRSTNNSSSNIVRYSTGLYRSAQNDVLECFQHCNANDERFSIINHTQDDNSYRLGRGLDSAPTTRTCFQDGGHDMTGVHGCTLSTCDRTSDTHGISLNPSTVDRIHYLCTGQSTTRPTSPNGSVGCLWTHREGGLRPEEVNLQVTSPNGSVGCMWTHGEGGIRPEEVNLQVTSNPDSGIEESASEKNVSLIW